MPIDDFMNRFNGVFVPLLTPIDEKGKIDLKSLERLVDHVVEGRVNGILANGATAEFYNLNREQRKLNLAKIVEYADGRVPVVANVTDNDRKGDYGSVLERTKQNIDDVAEVGADAIVICPYFYDDITEENVVEFTKEVADYAQEKRLPLVLYNHPGLHTEKGNIAIRLIKKLKSHGNIVGIKDSSGDVAYFRELLKQQDEKFKVFQGSEKKIFSSFAGERNPIGIVPSLANIATHFVLDFYEKLMTHMDHPQNREIAGACEAYQQRMDEACKAIYGRRYDGIVEGLKFMAVHEGLINTRAMAVRNCRFSGIFRTISDKYLRQYYEAVKL